MRPYYEIDPCKTILDKTYGLVKPEFVMAASLDVKVIARMAIGSLLKRKFSERFKPEDFQHVPMPVTRNQGRFLYQLIRFCKPRLVVEFGSSFGVSALFMGAALKDLGAGKMIGTEIEPNKAAIARENIEAAGLSGVVEIWEGDALETLKDIPGPVDLLFLDGWKDLYLPIAQMLAPRMEPGSILIADDIDLFPKDLKPVREFLADSPDGQFLSTKIPVGDGFELAVKL